MKAWPLFGKLALFFISAINIILFVMLSYRWFLSETVDAPPMTRSDYLDLSLTLLGIMLTVVLIFLAISAFFAYYDLRQAAERMAEDTTMSVFQKLSQEGYIEHRGYKITLEPQPLGTTSVPPAPDPDTLGLQTTKEEEEKGV